MKNGKPVFSLDQEKEGEKMEDERFLDKSISIVMKIAYWARRYPELYEPGNARNTIANKLAQLFHDLDELRKDDSEYPVRAKEQRKGD